MNPSGKPLNPNCEVCGKHKNIKQHFTTFIPYPGALREHVPDWHDFVPHMKHKMALQEVRTGYLKTNILYVFECTICGYKHQCLKTDFHRASMITWPNLDQMFGNVNEAFATMNSAFSKLAESGVFSPPPQPKRPPPNRSWWKMKRTNDKDVHG